MSTLAPNTENEDEEMSLVEHLVDLRRSLINILLVMLGVFVLMLPFNQSIYELFARPVLMNLMPGQKMLAQQPIDVFLTPIKVCFFMAVLISIPWTLYQIWRFVAPGMYRHEKRLMLPMVVSSTLLFYLGVLFAYFVILPLMFSFLVKTGASLQGVELMPDITSYVSLSLAMFMAFGLVFEVPVATVILIRMGVVEIKTLTAKRPYIILIAFVVGMVLTPPDIFSQTLLAVPMLVLFEIGILVAKYWQGNTEDSEEEKAR